MRQIEQIELSAEALTKFMQVMEIANILVSLGGAEYREIKALLLDNQKQNEFYKALFNYTDKKRG